MAKSKPSSAAEPTLPDRTHEYTDEQGNNLYRVCRIGTGKGKTIWQEPWGTRSAADGRFGGWKEEEDWLSGANMNGVRLVLYRLPNVRMAAGLGMHVYLSEGEKGTERIEQEGEVATSNPGGAGKWRDSYSESMKGVGGVTLCVDKDEEGWDHARKVVASLRRVIPGFVPIETVEAKEGHDVYDHLEAGLSLDEMVPVDLGGDAPEACGDYERMSKEDRAARAEAIREDVVRSLEQDDGNGDEDEPNLRLPGPSPWPVMGPKAYHGLAGVIAKTIAKVSECDPAALLVDILVSFGSAVGAGPYMMVEATRHPPRLWMLQVGRTAKSRKGTTHDNISRLFRETDADWYDREISGLASGEAIVAKMTDSHDPPVDRRLLVMEREFAKILAVGSREGSNIIQMLQDAWDKDRLEIHRSKGSVVATNTHISIVGHITVDALRKRLTDSDIANGFANRFLFVCSKRTQLLSSGGGLSDEDMSRMGSALGTALEVARDVSRMERSLDGEALWHALYTGPMAAEIGGLVGELHARDDAQTMRLSMVFALLDGSEVIDTEHIEAAWAVWKYCADSAAHLFPTSTGNKRADKIYEELARCGGEMTRKQINRLFHSNVRSEDLDAAIAVLVELGLVEQEEVPTRGRPAIVVRILST